MVFLSMYLKLSHVLLFSSYLTRLYIANIVANSLLKITLSDNILGRSGFRQTLKLLSNLKGLEVFPKTLLLALRGNGAL